MTIAAISRETNNAKCILPVSLKVQFIYLLIAIKHKRVIKMSKMKTRKESMPRNISRLLQKCFLLQALQSKCNNNKK